MLTERSDGWGKRSGGGAGRVGTWESQSFGLRFCPLAESLARGRVDFKAKSSPNRRGVESVKFGHGVFQSVLQKCLH